MANKVSLFCFQRVRGQNGSLGRLLDEFNNYRNSGNKKFSSYFGLTFFQMSFYNYLILFKLQIVIYKTFLLPILPTDKLLTKRTELPQLRVSSLMSYSDFYCSMWVWPMLFGPHALFPVETVCMRTYTWNHRWSSINYISLKKIYVKAILCYLWAFHMHQLFYYYPKKTCKCPYTLK